MNGVGAPAQTTEMNFLPGWSFSLSMMRCRPAVKSVVPAGRYSSCTILAFLSASLKALTPSRPKALSCASVAIDVARLVAAPRHWRARPGELLRPVRKMYLFHLSPVIESATAGSTSRIFLYSSATGSIASATGEAVGPTAMSTLSSA